MEGNEVAEALSSTYLLSLVGTPPGLLQNASSVNSFLVHGKQNGLHLILAAILNDKEISFLM